MFNKLLAESYNKVRSKADEVRQTVTLQAAKAREALGLPSPHDAAQLARQLEHQASQASTLNQLHDLYVKWIAQMTYSEAGVQLYFDYPQAFSFDLPSFILGTAPEPMQTRHGTPPGDLSSSLSWIFPYQKRTENKGAENELTAENIVTESGDATPPPPPPELDRPDDVRPLDESGLQCVTEGITFRQVFLRSQALEIALLSLARLEQVRSCLLGPLDENGLETSTRGALQKLMSLTMRGDAKVQTELLFLFCSVDLKSEAWEVHLRHLAELSALLKLDWQDDHYKDQMNRIGSEIDALKYTIHQATIPPIETGESCRTSAHPGTEEFDAEMEATAAQLEKRSEASRKIAQLRLRVDSLMERSAERSKIVEAAIAQRFATLLSSADGLDKRYLTLGSKATDRGQLMAHESEVASADLEKRLTEVMARKLTVDQSVDQLQQQRRELLAHLEAIEVKLVELLTEQRHVHDLVDSLHLNRDTMKKNFEHRVAVGGELKRQIEMHHLDMKNMKILIEQSKCAIQTRVVRQTKDMEEERVHLSTQTKLNIVAHLENEIERLHHDSSRIVSALQVLEDLWESKRDKAEQLKERREKYINCQLEYRELVQQQPEQASQSSFVEEKQKLENLGAAVDAASGGLEILKAGVRQAQWRCLHATNHLDTIWHTLTGFVETASSHIKDDNTLTQKEDSDKDEFVDVGEFQDAQESNTPPMTSRPTDKDDILGEKFKDLVSSAQSIYVKAKKAVTTKSYLLSDFQSNG